ncbi:hypothetical protein [Enterobacter cloacae]|uniref:hypothetical protein n=1 Tax=Enterobacter cloacae TaxID=550 RepID=UPI000F87F0B8|nr:hypothetical protein [Enterobacter cloacae]MBN4791680.1 hypothetical protein [Enterobacter cloacae]RTO60646.1 hypothetical protein EKN65_09285 [Enterobacter cloacae]HBL8183052.1 hypothetical protein [Enterobacter cloacae]
MRDILIVTTESGFFAQNKYPWSSMDISLIKELLEKSGYFNVNVVTFEYLKENINNVKGNIIIYTSSQRTEHKKYIEDIIYHYKENNLLIPSYESLLAHDNKGFQCLLSKKYDLGLIESNYYCDISEISNINRMNFPLVFKPANGASSMGVRKINNVEDLKQCIHQPISVSLDTIKRLLKKYLFRSKFNKKWDDYISYGKSRFLLQSFIPGLLYDYKVLIFGRKYYVLKRFVAKNDFKASGSGLHSRDIGDDLITVLDCAKSFKNKLTSHIYSLDICVKNGKPSIIEFQLTHVGPVTLTESEHYYIFDNEKWNMIEAESNLEVEFITAVKEYINENSAYSS